MTEPVSPAYARLKAAAKDASEAAHLHAMHGMKRTFQLCRRWGTTPIPPSEVLNALGLDENANTIDPDPAAAPPASVGVAPATDQTPCGPAPDQCDDEPCVNHEREQAHAEGEHAFCGPECDAADQTGPSRRAGLRQQLAAALIAWTPRGEDTYHGKVLPAVRANAYGRADAALAVLYREWPWLRAEAEDAAVSQPAADQTGRRDRYAAAMAKRDGDSWPTEYLNDEHDYRRHADAVMAVADAEQAELRAELKRARAELQCHAEAESADAAAGSYAGRAEQAEAAIERVRAVAERWENALAPDRACARSLRAALDSAGPAAVPADDQTALVDLAAQALADIDGWKWAEGFKEHSPTWHSYQQRAAAVLAVLPDTSRAAAELATARATNQRLNLRAQQLESELAAYRRAVAEWELSERGTYIPLRSLTAIAKAAGKEFDSNRYELHFERIERLEAELRRVAGGEQQGEACDHESQVMDHEGEQYWVCLKCGTNLGRIDREQHTNTQTADSDRIVAHVPAERTDLYCLRCVPPGRGDFWTPITAEELEDGGLCSVCGRDVLIPQPSAASAVPAAPDTEA